MAPEALDPLLRACEGCARADLGEIEGANLVKFHRHSGQVSYLVYPDFDADPHPALLRSIKRNLRPPDLRDFDLGPSWECRPRLQSSRPVVDSCPGT